MESSAKVAATYDVGAISGAISEYLEPWLLWNLFLIRPPVLVQT